MKATTHRTAMKEKEKAFMQDYPNEQNTPEEDDSLVLLEDENGELCRFEFLETLHLGERHYAVLIPLEDSETDEEASIVFLEILEFGKDTEHYEAVTDTEQCRMLFRKFQEEFGDQYQFSD